MKHNIDTLNKALQTYGIENQLDMLVEECSELIQAVCKLKRANSINKPCNKEIMNIFSEMADVYIVMKQVRINYFDADSFIQEQIDFKETRLANNLNKQ